MASPGGLLSAHILGKRELHVFITESFLQALNGFFIVSHDGQNHGGVSPGSLQAKAVSAINRGDADP